MLESNKKSSNTVGGLAPHERRAYPRYAFNAAVDILDPRSGVRSNGLMTDIGGGGCYVNSSSPFLKGTELKIRVMKGTASFSAQARVVYASAGVGMGLVFTVIETDQRRVLERWLAELHADSPAEPQPAREVKEYVGKFSPGSNQNHVLSELIITLVRNGALTGAEGKALQKLLHQ